MTIEELKKLFESVKENLDAFADTFWALFGRGVL